MNKPRGRPGNLAANPGSMLLTSSNHQASLSYDQSFPPSSTTPLIFPTKHPTVLSPFMAPPKSSSPSSHLILFLIFFLFALNNHTSFAADTIFANQSLSGNQTLVSEGGNFVLGFFQPGNSSQKYYIGIWYKKVSQLTPVWVANRETPVSDPSSSELKISSDGNLVLLIQPKELVWSTNVTSIASRSTVAVLNDTGNLILRDGSNSSNVLWQSFDHPTDTWLPGGKLGLNKITNKNQHLTAWKNNEDPAPGIYSLEIDPAGTGQYFILRNNSMEYWSSGPWDGHIFSGVPEMMALFSAPANYIYDFNYVNDRSENYFTYSVKDKTIISRFIIHVSGQIQQLTWLDNTQQWNLFWSEPRAQCDVIALCGPFGMCSENGLPYCSCLKGFNMALPGDWALGDQTSGCVRNTPLQCDGTTSAKADKDKFYQMGDVKLPNNSQTLSAESADDCASACLNNCSCTAYSYSKGCSLWYGGLLNLQQLNDGTGETIYLRLAASELPSSKSRKGLAIGVAIGIAAAVVACMAIVWFLISRQRRRWLISKSKTVGGTLVAYRYSDLQHVTKNFSEKLGGGGFGSVFKGVLPDSTPIAVKKLEGLRQGEKQFRTEVTTIGTIQHVNLVRLWGLCSQGIKRLLVYEYMPKGSLADQLFQDSGTILDWNTRYQIALGTARGLAYLHEKCRDCIIHCDIKPENILLDASFVPKVADFGLAKLMGRDFSRVLTTMRGTRGYLAPEWISGVAITAKADVYSYGMMLFEIISGRRNSNEGNAHFFPTFAANKLVEGDVLAVLDHRLGGDANMEEVERACRVACWCVQDDENFRPTMGQVVQILEGVIEVNMPPIPRSLQILAENPDNIVFFTESSATQSSRVQSTTSTSPNSKSTTSTSSEE